MAMLRRIPSNLIARARLAVPGRVFRVREQLKVLNPVVVNDTVNVVDVFGHAKGATNYSFHDEPVLQYAAALGVVSPNVAQRVSSVYGLGARDFELELSAVGVLVPVRAARNGHLGACFWGLGDTTKVSANPAACNSESYHRIAHCILVYAKFICNGLHRSGCVLLCQPFGVIELCFHSPIIMNIQRRRK